MMRKKQETRQNFVIFQRRSSHISQVSSDASCNEQVSLCCCQRLRFLSENPKATSTSFTTATTDTRSLGSLTTQFFKHRAPRVKMSPQRHLQFMALLGRSREGEPNCGLPSVRRASLLPFCVFSQLIGLRNPRILRIFYHLNWAVFLS